MKLNIETDDGTAVVDADGDQPYKDAQFALGRLLDEAGEIDPADLERVYVVLQSDASADDSDGVVPVREQSQPVSAETSDDSDSSSTPDTEADDAVAAGPSGGPPSTADRGGQGATEYLSEVDREVGTITSASTHHVVLSLLDAADGRLRAQTIQERFPQAADGTISGVLSMLYKRKLANRERLSDVAGVKYEYWVAPHGRTTLTDMGTITPEAWASQ
jgi:DNA-binding HxlR family transcriptional regulator